MHPALKAGNWGIPDTVPRAPITIHPGDSKGSDINPSRMASPAACRGRILSRRMFRAGGTPFSSRRHFCRRHSRQRARFKK